MLTKKDKLVIVISSIVLVAINSIVRISTGNNNAGIAWIKECPVHFSIMVGLTIVYLIFMFFMFQKSRKK